MFGWMKPKPLPSKVLLLSAIPDNRKDFNRLAECGSDFIRSWAQGNDNPEELWHHYKASAGDLHSTLEWATSHGATVIRNFSLQDLQFVNQFDAVIILAHHSDNADAIEVQGEMIRTQVFVDAFPENASLYIDLTSCYSSYLISKLKARLPYSRIIGIDVATSLRFRLFLMNLLLREWLRHPDHDYLEALRFALSSIPDFSGNVVTENSIKLGGKLQSSIYAPEKAKTGEDFIVSVFLHKAEDSGEIELMARAIDSEATIKGTKRLSVKIKKGDRIDFQLTTSSQLAPFFKFDKARKGFEWDGEINDVEFVISVSDTCTVSAFVGKILICVNKEPVGDMLFKTSIQTDPVPFNVACAPFDFVPFDKEQEKADAQSNLFSVLESRIIQLQEQISSRTENHELLLQELEICQKCRDLLVAHHKQNNGNHTLRVFISSTSDMKDYRNVVRGRVEACEMYPDMYENWGQGDQYPRDVCCSHVLNSDIFICILGAKYGYVEPLWNKSMTEIEYRVAQIAGIPILVYLDAGYKEKIEQLNPPERILAQRQEQFIEDVKNKRLVGIFPNEMALSLLASSELLTIKYNTI